MLAEVRRFNRTVTQRVGALHDQYLRAGLTVRDDAAQMRKIEPAWRRHVGDW